MRVASFERDALQDLMTYATMLGGLCVIWIGARRGIAWAGGTQVMFDDQPAESAVTLELWDGRSS